MTASLDEADYNLLSVVCQVRSCLSDGTLKAAEIVARPPFDLIDQQDEMDYLRDRVRMLEELVTACAKEWDADIDQLRGQHDARVTELLAANNLEVERRRAAEHEREELRSLLLIERNHRSDNQLGF